MTEKLSAILPGTVENIIQSAPPSQPEKAQIAVEEADHLLAEIRIANTLTDETGEAVHLKRGDKVQVTVKSKADTAA